MRIVADINLHVDESDIASDNVMHFRDWERDEASLAFRLCSLLDGGLSTALAWGEPMGKPHVDGVSSRGVLRGLVD